MHLSLQGLVAEQTGRIGHGARLSSRTVQDMEGRGDLLTYRSSSGRATPYPAVRPRLSLLFGLSTRCLSSKKCLIGVCQGSSRVLVAKTMPLKLPHYMPLKFCH